MTSLLVGVTSDRLVEYQFVARNLMQPKKAGTYCRYWFWKFLTCKSDKRIWKRKMSNIQNQRCRIRLRVKEGYRMIRFSNEVINQVTCKSTIDRIGIELDSSDTDDGDVKQSKRSTYFEKERQHRNHRPIWQDQPSVHSPLQICAFQAYCYSQRILIFGKQELYCYNAGKWKRCSQCIVVSMMDPLHLHSMVCTCVLVKKR